MTPETLERLALEAGMFPARGDLLACVNRPGVTPAALARFAALVRAEFAADLAQALCDDCENGVKWLNESAAAKFAKDYPHLRAALSALGETK